MIEIRKFDGHDWAGTWQIIKPVFRAGETYAFSPGMTEEEAHRVWIEIPMAVYVVIDDQNEIVGTYYIKPNQPKLGSHVCNCGYIVSKKATGKGIASRMCVHSQQKAVKLGFVAMQYNLVVSTNANAIHLWEKHGFNVVGTLPEAFRHTQLGLVDALVMYKKLMR